MGTDRLQETLRRLQHQDPLELGTTEAVWHVRLLEGRRYSRIFELRPEPERRDAVVQRLDSDGIVLKIYHSVQAPRRQREFDDLQRLQEICGAEARHAVVRPVAVYADLGALLTAHAAGRPGAPLLRAACRTRASQTTRHDALSLCAQAGTWLHQFQQSQGRGPEAFSPHLSTPEQFADYVATRLQCMQRAPFAIGHELQRRTADALQRVLRENPQELRQSVWSHSDYGPHNLLADSSHFTVLDFELMPQHPWFDAAYFVESLAGFSGPLFRAQRVHQLQQAFLDAYGISGDEPLFLALRLRHLLCTAASLRARRSRLMFLDWPEYALLRRRLQRLVERIESSSSTSGRASMQSA
jgi:hypothetical protein